MTQVTDLHTNDLTSRGLLEQSNLTRNQFGFWVGHQVSTSGSTYNMGQVYRLHDTIDVAAFRAAFSALLSRSDALRTRFRMKGDAPWQEVANRLEHTVPVVDLSSQPDPHASLDSWCRQRICEPMDISTLCFDTALIRLGDSRWAWYFCIHHLIGDGTSVDLIFRYVGRFYELAVQGSLHEAAELPQFSSYLERERAYRNSDAFRADQAWWTARSSGRDEAAAFYGNRRSDGDNRCVRRSIHLEASRSQRLVATVGARLGAGLGGDADALIGYLAVLAAYQRRTAGARTLVVGVPFHNRTSRTEKGVVGLLMEVVPLTIRLDDGDTFTTLLDKARSELNGVLRHYRFGSAGAGRQKAYDVMFNLVPSDTECFAGVPCTATWIHSGEWNESLTVQVQRCSHGDTLYFDMNQSLFPGRLAERAPGHFVNLLEQMLERPDLRIGEAELVPPEERELLRGHLENPGRTLASAESVVSHFEMATSRYPDSIAVVDGARRIDYQTLNSTANRMARWLRHRGVEKGQFVGVCVPRSVERVAVITAILKTGAAYVPIDDQWPAKRLKAALSDVSVRIAVCQSDNIRLRSVAGLELLALDEAAPEISAQSPGNPDVPLSPEDAAYVNFTSGSTGRPKGVVVPHGGIVRLTVDADYGRLGRDTVILNMSSISFDASTFELWGALLCGGTVVLLQSDLPTTAAVRDAVARFGVNTMFVTTSLFNVMIDEDPAAFSGVTQLLTGGEAASPRHFAKARAVLPDTRLIHCYGPTECTTFTTTFTVTEPPGADQPVPIGKPIANTSAHVLDDSLQDVPIGASGELYVSGAGVAIAYASQPDLTAEKFVRLPAHGGRRAYATGDVVRVEEDGNLIFIGRRDNQVKIRGFRIELDEVERAVSSLREVRRCAVVVHTASDGSSGIAAYVVAAEAVTPAQLRSLLSELLPKAMTPRWFVLTDELPIGPTGKLDRGKLPAPVDPTTQAGMSGQPADELERSLAGLWEEVLGVSAVGLHSDFFDLGGDSIRAIQVAARASAAGLSFDAAYLFRFPTLSELARALRDRAIDGDAAGTPSGRESASLGDAEMDAILSELEA